MVAVFTAFWLGILTSLSPCPLATNVAAVSFLSNRVSKRRDVLLAGGLYTFGRVLSYSILGALLVGSIASVPDVSFNLQRIMNRVLGPLLVVVGMVLLDLIRLPFVGVGISERVQNRMAGMGFFGALPMGAVFALAFCPVSAALFFGSLIPLAVQTRSPVTFPLLYGIGTAIPVVVFAIVLAFGAQLLGRFFVKIAVFEKWMRLLTGVIFIGVGIYYTLVYLLKVIT